MLSIKRILYIIFIGLVSLFVIPLQIEASEQAVDDENIVSNNDFTNAVLLNPLFEKLYRLENGLKGQDKVNIVHIGDSHIQADLLTNTIRQALQARFGNGGYGFTFPYKLAKTNGGSFVKYSSNIEWDSRRNIYPITDVSIGLSGIGLYTSDPDFLINVEVEPPYNFNTIKLIYSTKESSFAIRGMDHNTPLVVKAPSVSYKRHKIKSGETLSSIARKYSTNVQTLKRINKLKSNLIHKGKTLLIETKVKSAPQKTSVIGNSVQETDSLYTDKHVVPYCSIYTLPQLTNSISLSSANKKIKNYSLNGIVIENNTPGVIYSNIGVNGAKVSDFLKYPLFFEQLPLLRPDLVIVSFGTNESFAKWSAPYFLTQMQEMIDQIKAKNPNTIILVMAPSPSLARRNTTNLLIDSYAKTLGNLNNCIFWNLLDKLGGIEIPRSSSFAQYMAKDKVHYTKEGYEMQGELFLADFMSAYANYVKYRKNWTQY